MTDATAPAAASTTPPPTEDLKKRRRELVDKLLARSAVRSQGEVRLGGKAMPYAAALEFIPVTGPVFADAGGEPEAAVFTTAYTLQGAEPRQRPVCFAFNGGPGSASVWLHLGALGPKRVQVNDDGSMPLPPYAVSDNPHSWFEHFDLVFVDPPHTGYSIAASEEARNKLLGVDGDVEALAEVVRSWLGRNQRWDSPIYLAGESYGTTRGAALADRLQSLGVALNGLILVSCAMDLQSIVFAPRNDLPHALFLPAFAGVAQYHGKLKGALGKSPEAARRAAEEFVEEDYLRALHRGAALDGKARDRIARRIAELTGLAPAFVAEKNLRVADQDFFFELLRDQGRMVGRLDARVTGPMAASRTRTWEFDPGIETIAPAYTMAALGYMGRELGMATTQRYEILSMEVHKQWNWNRGEDKGNGFASTSGDLARAMRRNPHLKVLVASGHYDLGTPYSASNWSLAQLDAPPEVLARIEHHYYDAGHMMYTREADLVKLKADLVAWLAGSGPLSSAAMTEQQQLKAAIAALEGQRSTLGDAVVESLLSPARARLAALTLPPSPPSVPAQTLRQVSILFLDVVGSTALAQYLDPEAISAVMDDALARGTVVVHDHASKVLQYAGDSILAVFGADEAREDDAERAVRCGLALLHLGKKLGAEVRAAHGHDGFDVRVGIHVGGVLLGGGVDADGNIRGIAVNIAARMEQTAPAGALRISHDAYAQVRGLFEVERQEALAVKGVDEPIQSYLVLRAKARSFRLRSRGIEGVATRMIGRDAELEALQDAFKRLFLDRRLAAVSVVADAGIGKSRLLYEFASWSDARPESFFLFRGHATPQTQGQPFGLLRDIIAWRLQIADDDSIETARRKMEQGLIPLFLDDDGPDLAQGHAHLLGHLIGLEWRESRHVKDILDDPKQIRNRAFHAAAQLFRRIGLADGLPVVLELEDLHWADNESLDFLAYLTEVDRDVPLLILACCRPTLFERRASWCAERIHHRIDLQPLGKDMSRLLVTELLKKLPEVPAALRELVTGGAEGNPFYMEELVKMLIDQGAIEADEVWKVNAERLLLTKVPTTLTGVLQARLDGLPAPERLALQQASVIGPVFWDRALVALDTRAFDSLPALVRRELALPRADSRHDDLREYAFKHQILHQVTYATVLKRTRRELHGKLARWLAAQTGLRANDFLGEAAKHFELAGDEASSAEYHTRAAEHARTRMAHEAVLDHVRQALALLGRMPEAATRPLRWRLLEVREATLDIQGDRVEQRADVDALAGLAEAQDDDRRRAHAAWRRSALAHRLADYVAAEAAARQAVGWARRVGDDETRLLAQRMLAMALTFQGRLGDGRALAEEALADARALALRRVEGLCLNALSVTLAMQSDDVGALQLDQQSLAAHRAAGDRRNEAIAHGNIGAGWLGLGELTRARVDLEEGFRLLRFNGERALEVSPLCALSTLALWQGDDARALAQGRAALETAVAIHAPDQEAAALCRVGDAELALGRYAAAAQAFAAAHARASEIASPYRHDATAGLARVALAQGDVAAAMQALAPLLALTAEAGADDKLLDGVEFPRLVEWTCHRVLRDHGDRRAAEWLARAHRALEAQAATITDASLRQGFLRNIPAHREIAAAWAMRSGD